MSSSGDGEQAGDSGDVSDTGGTGDPGDRPDWQEDPEPDPPSLGPEVPSVDVPEVEIPGTDSETGGADVDVDTAKGFWRLVLIFDVALLALALGPMFVYFQNDWRRGGLLLAFGAFAFLYGVARYRKFQAAKPEADDDPDGEDDPDADVDQVDEA